MSDYERIAKVIRYIRDNYKRQPELSELAAVVDLSEFHFHRLFSRWVGVTPKEFLQWITYNYARRLLKSGESVLNTSLDSGLSGPARLHDLCIKLEAATPGEIKSGGKGWVIEYGYSNSPFGQLLMGLSPRGVCYLGFTDTGESNQQALRELQQKWPNSTWSQQDKKVEDLSRQIFEKPQSFSSKQPLQAFVKGTPFQIQVWRALMKTNYGTLTSYGEIAKSIGNPSANRAVGTAVGQNPISILIPCHRVIRESGELGGYHWGVTRKQAIIATEAIATSAPS